MRSILILVLGFAAVLRVAESHRITVPLRLDRTAMAQSPGPVPSEVPITAERTEAGYLLTVHGVTQTIVVGGSVAVEVNQLPYVVRDVAGKLEWVRHYKMEGVLDLGPCRQPIDLRDYPVGKSFEFCGRLLAVDGVAPDASSITFREVSRFTAKVGQPAPGLTLTPLEGGEVHLQQLRKKPLLLDFWASWCDVCLGEFPTLRKLHDSGAVEILSINIDDPAQQAAAKTILRQENPRWAQVMTGEGESTSAWQVFAPLSYAGGMPLYVLIDTKGIIHYAGTGGGIKLPEVHTVIKTVLLP